MSSLLNYQTAPGGIHRENQKRPEPCLKKQNGQGGNTMLKRVLLLLAGIPIAGLLLFVSKPAYAAGSDTAYIVLRCTVTMSVSLVEPNTWYNFGDISAAATYYSTTPIIFRNDSNGAICRWDLNIDAASLSGWALGNQPGLDQIALFGLFRKTNQPTDTMFQVTNSSLSVTTKEYNGLNFYDSDYDSDGYSNDASKILPKAYADQVGKSADRKLWLKIMTPTLVTDQTQRTLHLVVTAKMAS